MAYARDFDAAARRRRRARRKARQYVVLAGAAACILLVSAVITAVINAVTEAKAPPASSTPHAVTGTEMLAPLPMQGGSTAAVSAQFGPEQQTGSRQGEQNRHHDQRHDQAANQAMQLGKLLLRLQHPLPGLLFGGLGFRTVGEVNLCFRLYRIFSHHFQAAVAENMFPGSFLAAF